VQLIPRTILIIDDEPLVRRSLARHFTAAGWSVLESSGPLPHPEGYEHVDAVIADWQMPNGGGLRVLDDSPVPVVIYTAHVFTDDQEPEFVVHKPAAKIADLFVEVERAIEEHATPMPTPKVLTAGDLPGLVEGVATAPFRSGR
jgi:CheY-like chemotaxis protein